MGINEKIKDVLVSISGAEGEIYKEDVSFLLQGCLPEGWNWVPCSTHALVAVKGGNSSVYYKEFLPRNRWETLKAFFRGSRCQRARKQTANLLEVGLTTPELLCWGEGKQNEFIVFASHEGQGFHSFLRQEYLAPLSPEKLLEKRQLLYEAGRVIALLHDHGLIHGDLRPDNLLVVKTATGFAFSFLDNERNRQYRKPSLGLIRKNLIQFTIIPSSLLPRTDLLRFLGAYLSASGKLENTQQRQFIRDVLRLRHKRLTFILTRRNRHQRAKKISKIATSRHQGECYADNRIMTQVLAAPSIKTWFIKNGDLLKQDNAITVKIFQGEDGQILLGKGFQSHNGIHFLKCLLRKKKVKHLWHISHVLLDLGIPVPTPVSYLLGKGIFLTQRSFFFCEYLSGFENLFKKTRNRIDLPHWFAENQLIERLGRSLGKMHNLGFSHGDTKWGNIMVSPAGEEFCWIDLDSVRKVKQRESRWFYKDVARFIVSMKEGGLDEKWIESFLLTYAQVRCLSLSLLKDKIEYFVVKISKRHRRKGKIGGGFRGKFIHNFNSLLRDVHQLFPLENALVLGDSHAAVFKQWQFIRAFPKIHFAVCSVGGATVSGLVNPQSKTQAHTIFKEALSLESYKKVIVLLGEVDTGFVIWYRAQKYGVGVVDMFSQAVTRYCSFLLDLSKQGFEVIVVSTPLPTIADGAQWGEIANLRKEVKTSLLQRTKLTVEFNKKIKAYCSDIELVFINLDHECLTANGCLEPYLKSKNPCDHHYDHDQYATLLVKSFNGVLSGAVEK